MCTASMHLQEDENTATAEAGEAAELARIAAEVGTGKKKKKSKRKKRGTDGPVNIDAIDEVHTHTRTNTHTHTIPYSLSIVDAIYFYMPAYTTHTVIP